MNIAVICAPQTFGCNTGMYSVDLAAWYFFHRHFSHARVRFFTLYSSPGHFGNTPFAYEGRQAFAAWESKCDLILYWGDFLHGRAYRQAMVKWLIQREPDLSREQASHLMRHFLYRLDAYDNKTPAVMLYGGTLLFNDWCDYSDTDYRHDLTSLLKRAKAVWMREPFSSAAIQYLTGNYQVMQGTDCALLLDRAALSLADEDRTGPESTPRSGRIGVFLGRSHVAAAKVACLLEALMVASGARPCWLNWGSQPFFLDRQHELLEFFPDMSSIPSVQEPVRALSALPVFDFIVSDTYHVCVNAWNFGIPAVCLLDDVNNSLAVNDGGLATRDKRLIFYGHYNLEPFVVRASEIRDAVACQHTVQKLMVQLSDKDSLQRVQDVLRSHASACEDRLIEEMS